MPSILTKSEALKLLEAERSSEFKYCLMCEIASQNNRDLVLFEDEYFLVFLSKYPRFWGHIVITSKVHWTSIEEIPDDTYIQMFLQAKRYSSILTRVLNASRIFISSLGSIHNRINSCPHFHIHIIPLYEDIKPCEVFTWENGIYQGSESEWMDLLSKLQ